MTFVQGAHRGYQSDGAILFAPQPARNRHHSLATINDLHLLVNGKS
jgi:hypothetical protein